MQFLEELLFDILKGLITMGVGGLLVFLVSPRARRTLTSMRLAFRLSAFDEKTIDAIDHSSQAQLADRLALTGEESELLSKIRELPEDALAVLKVQSKQSLEDRLRLPRDAFKRLAAFQDVHACKYDPNADEIANHEFYRQFAERVSRARDRVLIVGEGVVADKRDEERMMGSLIDMQREAADRQVTIVRIQTRPFISPWWRDTLVELFDAGQRAGQNYFQLYFGPTQFVYPCVIDADDTERACAEMMMPIGRGGFDPSTNDQVERAGFGVFLDGDVSQASFLQRKIERTLKYAIGVDAFVDEANRILKSRNDADDHRELSVSERALLSSLIRVSNKTELLELCRTVENFK